MMISSDGYSPAYNVIFICFPSVLDLAFFVYDIQCVGLLFGWFGISHDYYIIIRSPLSVTGCFQVPDIPEQIIIKLLIMTEPVLDAADLFLIIFMYQVTCSHTIPLVQIRQLKLIILKHLYYPSFNDTIGSGYFYICFICLLYGSLYLITMLLYICNRM